MVFLHPRIAQNSGNIEAAAFIFERSVQKERRIRPAMRIRLTVLFLFPCAMRGPPRASAPTSASQSLCNAQKDSDPFFRRHTVRSGKLRSAAEASSPAAHPLARSSSQNQSSRFDFERSRSVNELAFVLRTEARDMELAATRRALAPSSEWACSTPQPR